MTGTLPKAVLYTDGGCIGNPGPGGYAAVILIENRREELSGGFRLTTNNRMELTAAIKALKALPGPCEVMLYSDSRYLIDGITKGWARSWQANNWKKKDRSKAQNVDLWKQLLVLSEIHTIRFQWVEGHSGNRENERCDRLAVNAARGKNLPPDPGYESENPPASAQGVLFS